MQYNKKILAHTNLFKDKTKYLFLTQRNRKKTETVIFYYFSRIFFSFDSLLFVISNFLKCFALQQVSDKTQFIWNLKNQKNAENL